MTLHKTGWRERKHGHLYSVSFVHWGKYGAAVGKHTGLEEQNANLSSVSFLLKIMVLHKLIFGNTTESRQEVQLLPSSEHASHDARFFCVSNLAISTGFRLATVVRTKTVTQA